MDKIRVHVLYEHSADLRPHGCSYIRLIQPLTHPQNSDRIDFSWGIEYTPADVVILERSWKPHISLDQAEQVLEHIRRNGAHFIYSLDDNLLDLGHVTIDKKMAIRFWIREADGVFVSTQNLKQRLRKLNDKIWVIPNALDERLFGGDGHINRKAPSNREKVTIGYMGTYTHDEDLMMVLQALRSVLRRHGEKLEFQLIGGIADPRFLKAFEGLSFRLLPVPEDAVEYPQFVAWMKSNVDWDIAISPLAENELNRCKSDIKFLDYSILGIAGCYSQSPAYQEVVENDRTGYLVDESVMAWEDTLERIIRERGSRIQIARNAQRYVNNNCMLHDRAPEWVDAIFSSVNKGD